MKLKVIQLLIFSILCNINFLFSSVLIDQIEKESILIETKDENISYKDLLDRIKIAPLETRIRYYTIDGQKKTLELMLTEMLYSKKANEHKIDTKPEIIKEVHKALRPIMNHIYFEELFAKATKPSENDIRKFYDENKQKYTEQQNLAIQHLHANSTDIPEILELIEEGIDFTEIVEVYSINKVTALKKGIIRDIKLNGFISGIGIDEQLTKNMIETTNNMALLQSLEYSNSDDKEIVNGPLTTSSGIHFYKIISYQPQYTKEFDEVKEEIENLLTQQTKRDFYRKLIPELYARYKVTIQDDILNKVFVTIPFDQSTEFLLLPNMHNDVFLTSTHPDIEMTLRNLGEVLENPDVFEGLKYNEKNIREVVLRNEMEARTLYTAAQEDGIYQQNIDSPVAKFTRSALVLHDWYHSIVAMSVEPTNDEISLYYEENKKDYFIPKSRDIRQFVSKDKKTAQANRKIMNNLLKTNDIPAINNFIRQESLYPAFNGVIFNILQNGIIPGEGIDDRDEVYNAKVWKTKVGTLSDVFKNKFGEYVFFYLVQERNEDYLSMFDVSRDIKNKIWTKKIDDYLEQITNDLKKEYDVVIHFDRLTSLLTADEMFEAANNALHNQYYIEAIYFLNQIINEYSNTEYVYDALFMIAYIAVDVYNETEEAISNLQELIKKHPYGLLNDTAKYIINALKTNTFDSNMIFQ